MSVRNAMKCAVAMVALAAVMGQAQAATYDLNLTGVVANSSYSVVPSGTSEFDFWSLSLDGLSASNPLTVTQGDVLHTTITFDQSVNLAASVYRTHLALILQGSAFPTIDTGTGLTTISLFNAGSLVVSGGSGCGTSSQLAVCHELFPPDNTALTFDSATVDFTITSLGQPVTLDSAIVEAALVNPATPVPEPEVAFLALAGLACVGMTARPKKS